MATKTTMKLTKSTTQDCWVDIQDAFKAGVDRLVLYGPPGTGKTYAGLTMNTGDRPTIS